MNVKTLICRTKTFRHCLLLKNIVSSKTMSGLGQFLQSLETLDNWQVWWLMIVVAERYGRVVFGRRENDGVEEPAREAKNLP